MKNKLSEFREAKGLSQQEICEKIGVSISLYTKVEGGFRNPSFNFLNRLKSNFIDANLDEIFFGN